MRKVFKMEDLDCANCAAKMEDAISRIEGVESVSVSYIMQRLTLVASDDKFDDIVRQAQKVCRRIEPDCRIII
ncbi:MAG: cation transporter [Candidatus Fimadaptatus sp.]